MIFDHFLTFYFQSSPAGQLLRKVTQQFKVPSGNQGNVLKATLLTAVGQRGVNFTLQCASHVKLRMPLIVQLLNFYRFRLTGSFSGSLWNLYGVDRHLWPAMNP